MATLLHGIGLRECRRLRVHDVDFGMAQIVVRDGKGVKDRVTALPAVLNAALAQPQPGRHESRTASSARDQPDPAGRAKASVD